MGMVAENAGRAVRLRPELVARLEDASRETDRDVDELVNAAVESFLDEDERFCELVRQGLEEADAGDFLEWEEVEAKHRARIAAIRAGQKG